MRRVTLLVVIVLLAVSTTSCGWQEEFKASVAKQAEDQLLRQKINEQVTDAVCLMGVSFYELDVVNQKDSVNAYLVRPNNNCSLPTLYCVALKSGLSCVPTNLTPDDFMQK